MYIIKNLLYRDWLPSQKQIKEIGDLTFWEWVNLVSLIKMDAFLMTFTGSKQERNQIMQNNKKKINRPITASGGNTKAKLSSF